MVLAIGTQVEINKGQLRGCIGTVTHINSTLATVRLSTTSHQHIIACDNLTSHQASTSSTVPTPANHPLDLSESTVQLLITALDRAEYQAVRAFLSSLLPPASPRQGVQHIPTSSYNTILKLQKQNIHIDHKDYCQLTSPHEIQHPQAWTPVLTDTSILALLDQHDPTTAMGLLIKGAEALANNIQQFPDQVKEYLEDANTSPLAVPPTTIYNCHICHATFLSPTELSNHLYRSHDHGKNTRKNNKQPDHTPAKRFKH